MKKHSSDYNSTVLLPSYLKTHIPAEWNTVILQDLVTSHNSGVFKNREHYGSGENIVGVSDLYDHDKIDGQIFRLVELSEEEKKNHILDEGDLIYGESSLVKSGIGKSLYVSKRGAGTIFAWHTRRFKLNKQALPSFIYYMLDSPLIRKSIIARSTTTVITGITTKEYFGTKIPLPSLPEQKRIATIFSNLDDVLSQVKKLIEQTTYFKKNLMQKLLIEGIGHSKFKTVRLGLRFLEFNIPESWEIKNLKKIISDVKGGAPLKPRDFVDKGFPVLHKGDIKQKDIIEISNINPYCTSEFAEKHSESIIDKSFLVVTLRDLVPSGPTIGLIAHSKGDYLLAQGVYGFHYDKKKLDSNYLVHISNSNFYRRYMKSIAVGSTQIHIRTPEFFNILLPIPNLKEQQKISSILSNLDSKINTLELKKTQYAILKKRLMDKLLTGQIRVKL